MAPSSRNRRFLFLGIATACVFSFVSLKPVDAQSFCSMGATPALGSCVVDVFNHAGESPFALTVIDSNTLVVVDLFAATFQKYTDFVGGAATTLPTPLGGGQHTGVAWHPVEDALYWLINTGTGQQLVKSDNDGLLISSVPMTDTPGGLIGNFTYNVESDSFWGLDIENDIIFEFGSNGVASLTNVFAQPSLSAFGGGSYGVGITSVPDNLGSMNVLFDVTTGTPIAGRANRVIRANSTGVRSGIEYPLTSGGGLEGWVTGIAYQSTPTGSFEFLANATTNQILRLPAAQLTSYLPTATNFTCTADVDGHVTLEWVNSAGFSEVEIFRNGTSLGVQAGLNVPGPQTFMDTPLPGTHVYAIETSSAQGTPQAPNATCSVTVGRGRLVNFAALPAGSNPLAVTIAESTGHVYVVDLDTGITNRFDKNLALVDSISSPFGTNTTPGLTWRPGAAPTDDGTLFWFDADNGQLLETDLDGLTPGTAVSLASPANGAIADIAYAADTDSFWGVDLTMDVYFEFLADGSVTGAEIDFAVFGLGGTGWGNGVTAVGGGSALDMPIGALNKGYPDRVARVVTSTSLASGNPYMLTASTVSAFVNGIAWTDMGSEGEPSEYVVGNDTGHIYELSLKTPGIVFQRGDYNQNGVIDFVDAFNILQFVFNINPAEECLDAADANDDGTLNLVDGSVLLQFVFNISGPIPDPLGSCDLDPTTDLIDCEAFNSCPP